MSILTFKGRGFREVRLTITADDYGVRIRADCAQNDEAWAELNLPLAVLFDLLERVLVAHPMCLPDELGAIHDVAVKMRM